MSNYPNVFNTLLLLCLIFQNTEVLLAKPLTSSSSSSQKSLKKWIVEEVKRLSKKNLAQVGSIEFGEIVFRPEEFNTKNIFVYNGVFSDSNSSEWLACFRCRDKGLNKNGYEQALTLLIKKTDKGHSIKMGKPGSVISRRNLMDVDSDGYLDIIYDFNSIMHEIEKKHVVRAYSLRKNKKIYESIAKDKWTKASPMQKVLSVKGDLLYETLKVTPKKVNKKIHLQERRTKYICDGGKSVAEIKRKIKVNKTLRTIILSDPKLTKVNLLTKN